MIEVDEDNTSDIQISNALDWAIKRNEPISDNDPFNISGDELKKISGLSPAFRRKLGRELQKVQGRRRHEDQRAEAVPQARHGVHAERSHRHLLPAAGQGQVALSEDRRRPLRRRFASVARPFRPTRTPAA